MRSYLVGQEALILVLAFNYVHSISLFLSLSLSLSLSLCCVRVCAAKAVTSLRTGAGSSEPSLLAHSTRFKTTRF